MRCSSKSIPRGGASPRSSSTHPMQGGLECGGALRARKPRPEFCEKRRRLLAKIAENQLRAFAVCLTHKGLQGACAAGIDVGHTFHAQNDDLRAASRAA